MNIQALMKQAQVMQAQLAKKQKEFGQKEFTHNANGGAVVVKMTGDLKLLSLEVDNDLWDDREMTQDLIMIALNDAINNIQQTREKELSKGMPAGMPKGF